jgi:hypothetical protein
MSQGKNYSITGTAFLPYSWDSNGEVAKREFLVSFSTNWECDTVLNFKGDEYGKEEYENDPEAVGYYQTGSAHGLVEMSRALFMIHRLLEEELKKTDTYMYEEDNQFIKSYNLLDDCSIEIKDM